MNVVEQIPMGQDFVAQSPVAQEPAPAVAISELTHYYPAPRRSGKDKKQASAADGKALQRPALDDVTFSINTGEIFAVLGPNGGGKTTLFRILSTMLRPTPQPENGAKQQCPASGAVSIFGRSVFADQDFVRRNLGIVFQHPSLDEKLTAGENLMHHGHLYGLRGPELNRRIDDWLEHFGLLDRKHSFVEHFSGGMRRRVEIAKALLHEPKLLLMDEPATGLDPAARRGMWHELSRLRDQRGITVVFTTHLMEEAEVCNRLAILSAGQLVALDTPENLKAEIGGQVVTIAVDDYGAEDVLQNFARRIESDFGPWQESGRPQVVSGKIRFEKQQAAQVIAAISSKYGSELKSVTVGKPTLEDVFLRLTGSSLSKDAK